MWCPSERDQLRSRVALSHVSVAASRLLCTYSSPSAEEKFRRALHARTRFSLVYSPVLRQLYTLLPCTRDSPDPPPNQKMILSADEVDLLERACAKDETTPALVETICSCKSSADLCQVGVVVEHTRNAGFGHSRHLILLRTARKKSSDIRTTSQK